MTIQNLFTPTMVPGSRDASDGRTAARHARTLSILCVLLSAVTASAATGEKLAITTSSPTPQRRQVTFEEVLAGSVVLEFSDYPRGAVELYQPSATAETRAKQSCHLPVAGSAATLAAATPGEPCRTLLAPLWRGESFKLAVSVAPLTPSTVAIPYVLVEYIPPRAYQGPDDTTIDVPATADGAPDWQKPAIPGHVRLISPECYVRLDRLRKLTCDPGTRVVTPDEVTASMIAAKWGRKDEAALIARVADAESDAAWRVFPFRPKPQPPEKKPQIASLKDRCYETASSVEGKAENFYLICVDALQARRDVVTLSCEKPDRATCSRQRDLLDAGRDFFVSVWTAAGAIADVKLSGTVGYDPTYDPNQTDGAKARLESKGEEKEVQRLEPVGPRKPGTTKLTVTVKRDGEPFTVEEDYTIRGSYRVAIRLGVGLSWAPWARNVGIRTAADGQRYAAVVSGADGGLIDNELVAGVSYFFPSPVRQDSVDVRLALGLRIGVVDIGSNGGWFQSLMVGPELAVGPDLAIGIFGGLRRTALPDAGYEPGTLLPPGTMDTIPTHVGVTPAFGVVLNFKSGMLDLGVNP